jgi:tetratricopeptide (TPR) repeat protein
MRTGIRDVRLFEEGMAKNPDKPGPIRPQGISIRLSLLLFIAVVAALFIGYRYVADSEIYRTAETFVRQNEEIRASFGEVRKCRLWFPFKVDFTDGALRVHLTLQVEGAKADTVAYIAMMKDGAKWRVVAASYRDGRGQIRLLLKMETPVTAKGKMGETAAQQSQPKTKIAPEDEEMKRGHQAFRDRKFDQAMAAYEKAVLLAPGSFIAHYWRGRTFAEKGLDEKALADMQKTVELRPDYVFAWRWLGYLQAKKSRYDDCIVSLTKAINLQAGHAWTYYNRGRCHYKKGNLSKAFEDANKSCSLGLKEGCMIARQIKAGN